VPGGAGRRARAPGRLPGRGVVVAVGRAPDPAVRLGTADTCCARTRSRRWSSSATAVVLRDAHQEPGWGSGSIRRCCSGGRSTRQ
jgi:hypothetical protein